MKRIWNKFSFLGISKEMNIDVIRPLVLNNQINLIVLFFMLLVLIINVSDHFLIRKSIDLGTVRVLLVAISSLFNLLLAHFKKGNLSRILTAISPCFFFIYLPSFMGFIEEESFAYYPYIAIAFSIIPHFLFSYRSEKVFYLALNIYAFAAVLFSDVILLSIAGSELKIKPIILDFYIYYKISHVLIYLFINLSILYLKKINMDSEIALQERNNQLTKTLKDLKDTQDHLIQSEKMATLGILVSGIAHEINTPLNFIYLGMQNLELKLDDQRDSINKIQEISINSSKEKDNQTLSSAYFKNSEEFIKDIGKLTQTMKQGVERTNEIINSLSNYSRIDSKQMTHSNINNEIDNALLFLTDKHKRKINIVRNYSSIEPIKCYPGLLNQVFLNVLKNAMESINNNGEVIISTSLVEKKKKGKSYVEIFIKDNGKGIPKDKQSNLFDAFFTTKEAGKGTGLGLFISKSIIEKHEGTIKVKSEINKGTEFTIHIPAIY